MVYQWKIPLYPVPAQDAGEELRRIEKEKGRLNPQDVVEESREEGTVLHSCFEWDDLRAAEAYRKEQARNLICNIVAVEIQGVSPPSSVRAFVSVEGSKTHVSHYRSLDVVLGDQSLMEQMLKNALNELAEFRKKYGALSQLCRIFENIEDLQQKLI